MRHRTRIVVGLGIAIALGAPRAASADWPLYGHDLANSRSSRGGPTLAAARSMQRAWTFKSSNGDFTGTPVVAGGTLVAGTNLGTIYALDAVTGKLRWSREVGAQVNGSAAIDLAAPGGATVFVPVARIGSPHLVALRLGSGRVRWDRVLTRQPTSGVFGSPVYWHHRVYMGTSGGIGNDESTARGSVVALDEASGHLRWRTFTVPRGHDGGAVWTTPAIDTTTGRLYVGTGNAYHEPAAGMTDSIVALSASNGRVLGHFQATARDVWELNNPAAGPDYDFGASPNLLAGPHGRRLVGEGQKSGIYWALDRATMRRVWHRMAGPGSPADGGINSSAYDGSRIYGSDAANGAIFALGRDGSARWSSPDTGPLHFSPVAIGNGVVYSVDPHGFLIARNAASGASLNRLSLDAPLTFGGVSVVGRAVYAVTGTGPPSPLVPAGPDTSRMDGPGTIIAFGDTSKSDAPRQSGPRSITFSGRCDFSGTVRFQPALTNSPRNVTQHVQAPGRCSGTLVDRRGRKHSLSGTPVTFLETSHVKGDSCTSGTATGAGAFVFRSGMLRFGFSEVRAAAFPVATATGARSGSARGVATPAPSSDPTSAVRECGRAGLKRFEIEIHAVTAPSISG
jgi:polyvinyl alcohol dehydrogenase (cytochrome)